MKEGGDARQLVTDLAMIGGVFLVMSSYWIDDYETIMNRRYVGMILFGAGLAFKK
jgi:hypothetical protein